MAIYKWRDDGVTPRVAYRPLKTDYNDYSGNGNHLTASGGVSLVTIDGVQCAKGGNGAASSYLYSQTVQLPSGSSPRTFSFWYKEYSPGTTRGGYVLNYGSNDKYCGFQVSESIINNSNNATVAFYNSRDTIESSNIWGLRVHVAITYDGTDAKMYINGILDDSVTTTMNTEPVSSSYPFKLFNGQTTYPLGSSSYLSEVIVENVAWTQQQVQNYYNQTKDNYVYHRTPGANTLAYYPLTSDLVDYSGNGNDLTGGTGTYYNNMITTTTTLTKLYGISVGSSDFTLSARIDYDKCAVTAGTSGISLGCNSDGPIWGFWGPRSNTQRWVGGAKFNSWVVPYIADMVNSGIHCLHLVRSGGSLMLYIDGTLMGTASCSGTLPTGSYVRIGGLTGGNEVVTCGNVILEDVAWSAQEISDYYNASKSKYGIS